MTWQYWWLCGHTEENARYGEVIVASGEKLPPGQLGFAQIGLGVLRILSGGKARAQVLFEQAPALFRRLGDKRGIAIATGYLGHLAVFGTFLSRRMTGRGLRGRSGPRARLDWARA
jgi:hypothetical protein